MVSGMELSEFVKLKIKDSESYNSMVVCDLISRLQQKETDSDIHYKKVKKCNKNKD
mgnify:CR=1 FL=1